MTASMSLPTIYDLLLPFACLVLQRSCSCLCIELFWVSATNELDLVGEVHGCYRFTDYRAYLLFYRLCLALSSAALLVA